MTAILEFKQKLKNLYGKLEVYLTPVFKFGLALLYFMWINENMGYMPQLTNIYVLLVMALVCSILPNGVTIAAGFALMVAHCYAIGIDVAAFLLVLVLVMTVFLLRFSGRQNIILAFTPLSFAFNVPMLLPIGAGILGTGVAAIPAGCGVVIYYFIRYINGHIQGIAASDIAVTERLKLLCDALVTNWAMWILLAAFVVVTLLVNVIRNLSFDHSWRVAIVLGGIAYAGVVIGGGSLFEVEIATTPLAIYTCVSVILALVLEFFVFGGNYSRTERVQFEDDEYYYYVKAVPKAYIPTSERSIKRITAEPEEDDDYESDEEAEDGKEVPEEPVQKPQIDPVDFERKLEKSLDDL
ncbi:MAG: hypothetical protein HUJ72_02035 [Blautia sp.]|nr:hypothetical protein [Blautia sp.]